MDNVGLRNEIFDDWNDTVSKAFSNLSSRTNLTLRGHNVDRFVFHGGSADNIRVRRRAFFAAIRATQSARFISIDGSGGFPSTLCSVQTLRHLLFLREDIKDWKEIPQCIGQLSSLLVLEIKGKGSAPVATSCMKLPDSLFELSRLQVFRVRYMQVCSPLPELQQSRANLLVDMRNSTFNGTLPQSWINTSSKVRLYTSRGLN